MGNIDQQIIKERFTLLVGDLLQKLRVFASCKKQLQAETAKGIILQSLLAMHTS